MYGPEYLDWRATQEAAAAIDVFLAGFEPEDRKWVLSVLRDRFEVRVEYRDSLQAALSRQLSNQSTLESAVQRQRPCGQSHLGLVGGALTGVFS